MNSFEYWILENVVPYMIHVDWFNTNGDHFGMVFNRNFHNESQETCLTTLKKLLEQNYIYLCQKDQDTHELLPLASTTENLEKAFFDRKSDILYTLTAQGGQAWEDISRVNWKQYFDEGTALSRDEIFHAIEGLDRSLVEKKLEVFPYSSMGSVIDPESIKWTIREPWEALYWKTFPIAYYVRFNSTSQEPDAPIPEWIQQYLQEDKRWYINPFDPSLPNHSP